MARAKISLEPPPNIDPTKATLAYGRLALPRLNRELNDEELLTRQRSVKALSDYLHDHENIAQALKEGIVPSLKTLLADADVTCRALSTECFRVMCQHALGREAFLTHDVLTPYSKLYGFDEAEVVRLHAHQTLQLLARFPFTAQGIVDADLIDQLIRCSEYELDEIKPIILDTLNYCLRIAPKKGLEANGMKVFTALLSHPEPEVKSKAAICILRLGLPLDGKLAGLDMETIPALSTMLTDFDGDVVASALGALAFLTITTKGKYTAINCGILPQLLILIDHESSSVRVNAFKVIASLSEAPEGRRILLDHKPKVENHVDDENANVAKHARIALQVIIWKP